MNWPLTINHGMLGDGRPATARDCPETVESLCELMRERVREGSAIYPQGGKTSLNYGGIPARPGVAVETGGLSRVVDYPSSDMTITLEAGMTLGKLSQVLDEHQQRLLVDAPEGEKATLGGVFATAWAGPRRFGWGRPRDQVIGVSFVTSEGKEAKGGGRVVKNVAGYDFPKLMTGSMGTLGIITQLTLKVRPKPEATAIAWFCLGSAEEAEKALEVMQATATRPVAIELLNRPASLSIGGPLGLPASEWVLAVGFEDNGASVSWQSQKVVEEVDAKERSSVSGEEAERVWRGLVEFTSREEGVISLVANVRPSAVVGISRGFDESRWMVQAHAGNGVVRVHSINGVSGEEGLRQQVAASRAQAVAAGGNLVVSRCRPEWKAELGVWGASRGDWPVMERLKRAFDPPAALNPGRFVGSI